MKQISSWHVGVAAEAFTAGQFARCGYDVSVQYGANQPEYDLIVADKSHILKVSVKGSQDGSWGLTQKYKKEKYSYHEAIELWLKAHNKGTIFCLVQFRDVSLEDMPRAYLATPSEIAERLNASAAGRGETILYEHHIWTKRAFGNGTIDRIPDTWRFSENRIHEMMAQYGMS